MVGNFWGDAAWIIGGSLVLVAFAWWWIMTFLRDFEQIPHIARVPHNWRVIRGGLPHLSPALKRRALPLKKK